jgi:hypothetical protein
MLRKLFLQVLSILGPGAYLAGAGLAFDAVLNCKPPTTPGHTWLIMVSVGTVVGLLTHRWPGFLWKFVGVVVGAVAFLTLLGFALYFRGEPDGRSPELLPLLIELGLVLAATIPWIVGRYLKRLGAQEKF